MINAEAGKVLVEYSRHIARYAKLSEQGKAVRTPRALAARENAWRMLSVFVDLAHNLAESDMYWTLAELAEKQGKTPREQRRLYSVASAEDRGYMKNKMELEQLVREFHAAEKKKTPKAVKPAAKPRAQAVKSAPATKKVAARTSARKVARPAAGKKAS